MKRTIIFELPIRTQSEQNQREHWGAKARRTKKHRELARTVTPLHLLGDGYVPTKVHLSRIAPKKLDTDNLVGSFKATRDGIADAIGIDDGDERIKWEYDQRKGNPKEYAVIVEITLRRESK